MRTKDSPSAIAPEHIRNFSIISHVDHGKTTLSDHLIASGGMLPSNLAGRLRALDYLEIEQNRGITIDSSFATFSITYENQTLLCNIIDTPGHVDFSGKVAEALHLVDNGLIIVDAVEGIMAQTIQVLHQAILEKLNLVLFINKIDRLITELELSPKDLRSRIERIIGEVQAVCIQNDFAGELPTFRNHRVILGSALDGWGVDVTTAETIGGIDTIYKWYLRGQTKPNTVNLMQIFSYVIAEVFISPIQGQKRRNPVPHQIPSTYQQAIIQPTTGDPLIAITGKRYKTNKQQVASVIRIFTGTLNIKDQLYSNKSHQSITIQQIMLFRGKRTLNLESAGPGAIVGIVASDLLPVGDILTTDQLDNINYKINYTHNPTISITVEPQDLDQLDQLIELLEEKEKLYPDLLFFQSPTTGELILSGIGTLQLDVILEEVQEEIELYTGRPSVIEYMIPTIDSIKSTTINHTEIEVSKFSSNQHEELNQLELVNNDSEMLAEAFKQVFRQQMRSDPIYGLRIRDLFLKVKIVLSNAENRYEDHLIFAQKVVSKSIELAELQPHQPLYLISLKTPKSYIGPVTATLSQFGGSVHEISYKDGNQIQAELPIIDLAALSDRLRQITDGNILWFIDKIIYKKK